MGNFYFILVVIDKIILNFISEDSKIFIILANENLFKFSLFFLIVKKKTDIIFFSKNKKFKLEINQCLL